MEQKTYTQAGYDALQKELAEINEKIEENKKDISTARSYGDLSENSEYDEARAEQAENETRIEELEAILKSVEVVDDSNLSTDKVSLGSKVTLQNTATKQE